VRLTRLESEFTAIECDTREIGGQWDGADLR
jgi:hypothetical protein